MGKRGEEMMDSFEERMKHINWNFSTRHRLRWWTACGVRAWEKSKQKEKVQFT